MPKHPPSSASRRKRASSSRRRSRPARPAAARREGGAHLPGRHGMQPVAPKTATETRERGACLKPARRHRHAEHQGLDQSEGRAHRRRGAQEIPRDRRPEQPERRAAVPGRLAASLLCGAWLGRRDRQGHDRAGTPTRCGRQSRPARSRHRPRSRSATTTARGSSSPAPSRSTTISCSRSPTRWPIPAPSR